MSLTEAQQESGADALLNELTDKYRDSAVSLYQDMTALERQCYALDVMEAYDDTREQFPAETLTTCQHIAHAIRKITDKWAGKVCERLVADYYKTEEREHE